MAAKTGVKQQCPNCDALIPIKEAQFGKRIKCPRCGDPFLVEDPEIDAPPPTAKGSKAANGKAGPKAKTAPGRKRDDDDATKPKKKKSDSGNNKVVVGAVLGVVAISALAIAAYFVFFKEEPKKQVASNTTSSPQPPSPAPTVPTTPDVVPSDTNPVIPKVEGQDTTPGGTQVPAAGTPTLPPGLSSFSGSPISNMLLNETQFVLNIPMAEALKNPMGHLAFDHASVQRTLGFPVEAIEHVIASGSLSPPWIMVYVRTNKPVPFDNVKKALALTPAQGSPYAGQDFFQSHTNFGEALDSFLPEDYYSSVVRSTPILVRLHDPQTLVFGDLVPMKRFLDVKGQPKPQDPIIGTNPDGSPQQPGGFGGQETTPVIVSGNYRTIQPNLKAVLDTVETNKPYLFSSVIDYKGEFGEAGEVLNIVAAGASLHWPGGKERIVGMAVWQCKNEQAAGEEKGRFDQLITQLTPLAFLAKKVKLKTGEVAKPGERVEGAPGSQPGPGPAPGGPGGKGGGPPPEMPPAPGPGNPAQPGQPGTPGEIPDALADARITINLKQNGRNIVGEFDFDLEQKFIDYLFDTAKPYLTRGHGELEMASSNPQATRLGAAIKSYTQKEERFPQGAAKRDASAARFKRPWAPHQRISWMAELLPYLGHEQTYDRIDFKRSWSDSENINVASTLIPEFLAPDAPHRSWYVKYPGVGPDVAATSYVGIAGIGLDATLHDINDPKRGIFAYDRPTRLSEIENLARTILLIQVPPSSHVPWMSGGGTTVRGMAEKNSIEAFLPPKGKGKRGTHIIMADGSVRYVTESISDDVLKTLAVIKGKKGELSTLDTMAPVVKPGEATMKAVEAPLGTPAPAAPPGGN